jgi:hypothetical protein
MIDVFEMIGVGVEYGVTGVAVTPEFDDANGVAVT